MIPPIHQIGSPTGATGATGAHSAAARALRDAKVSTVSTRTRPLGVAAFTLVEIVMALGIVSFSLLATIGLFANGYLIANDAAVRTSTSVIASRVFGLVADELHAGNNPQASMSSYQEVFDSSAIALDDQASKQWAYRASVSFTATPVGSSDQNDYVLRAETRVESRRSVRTVYRYFAFKLPATGP